MEYVPDADMIFNYLMISALAAATDYIEREGLKPTGGKIDKCVTMFGVKQSSALQYTTVNTHRYGFIS